jgi:hypothetical protein
MFTTKYAKNQPKAPAKKPAKKVQKFEDGGPVTDVFKRPRLPIPQRTQIPQVTRLRNSMPSPAPTPAVGAPATEGRKQREPRWKRYGMPDPATLETNTTGYDITDMTPRARRYATEVYGREDKARDFGPSVDPSRLSR